MTPSSFRSEAIRLGFHSGYLWFTPRGFWVARLIGGKKVGMFASTGKTVEEAIEKVFKKVKKKKETRPCKYTPVKFVKKKTSALPDDLNELFK